jgi:hypothetical protein
MGHQLDRPNYMDKAIKREHKALRLFLVKRPGKELPARSHVRHLHEGSRFSKSLQTNGGKIDDTVLTTKSDGKILQKNSGSSPPRKHDRRKSLGILQTNP